MDFQSILFNLGCPTWVEDVQTTLPAVASAKQQIGNQLPTNIGYIYGLATYTDGVDADNNTLISTTDASNLYLTLQDGPTQFYQQIRLWDLLTVFAGTPVLRPQPYTPVNIPYFDLSKSFYQNPTGVVDATIRLKLYYIQMDAWVVLKKKYNWDFKRPSEGR